MTEAVELRRRGMVSERAAKRLGVDTDDGVEIYVMSRR